MMRGFRLCVCVYVLVCGAMGRKEANTSGLKRAPNCGHRAVCVRFVGKAHNFPTIIPSALSFPPPKPTQECIGEAYEKGNGRDAMKKQCSPTVSPALPFSIGICFSSSHTERGDSIHDGAQNQEVRRGWAGFRSNNNSIP